MDALAGDHAARRQLIKTVRLLVVQLRAQLEINRRIRAELRSHLEQCRFLCQKSWQEKRGCKQ